MNDVRALEPYRADAPWTQRFVRGMKAPFQSVSTLGAQTVLWPYVAVPIVVTAALMALALWATLDLAPRITDRLWPLHDGVRGADLLARNALWAVLLVATFVLSMVAAWFTGLILASPFYDRLSDHVERLHDAVPARTDTTPMQVVGDIVIGMGHSFANFALYMALACPLACVQAIPFLGEVLGMIGGTLLSSWLVAIEVLDFSLARRRYGWWQKLRWLWTHRATMLGLGFGSWVLLLIPLGGFIAMPVAVIAATELFVAMQRAGELPDQGSGAP